MRKAAKPRALPTYTGGSGNYTVSIGAISQTATITGGSGTDTINLTDIASRKTSFAHIAGLDSGDFINSNGALAGRQLYQ